MMPAAVPYLRCIFQNWSNESKINIFQIFPLFNLNLIFIKPLSFFEVQWIKLSVCSVHSRSGRGVQHYVISFVSDLRKVGGFPCPSVSSTHKTDRQHIAEILLKMLLNTTEPTNQTNYKTLKYHGFINVFIPWICPLGKI